MSLQTWWGYQSVKDAEFAWGARAIFKPDLGSRCLDLLHDRQGHVYPEGREEEFKAFVNHIRDNVHKPMVTICEGFNTSDSDNFIRHFPWPADPNKVVVVMGSPNGSYGYFYLSVSLVTLDKAPEQKLAKWEQYEEERQLRQTEMEGERKRQALLERQRQPAVREKKKLIKSALEEKLKKAEHKRDGEKLEVGDHFFLYVNQGTRHVFVKGIVDYDALAEYHMPNGQTFLVVVDVHSHQVLQNVSRNKIPKRWQHVPV